MDSFFFSEPTSFLIRFILEVVLLISFYISLKQRKKHPVLRLFPIYIISLFTDLILLQLTKLNFFLKAIHHYGDYIFTLIEFLIFTHFYLQIINNNFFRRVIVTTAVLFLIFFLVMAMVDHRRPGWISEQTQSEVYTVQSGLLLFICCFYFFEFYRTTSKIKISNQPEFWVSIGLLFFMLCTLPFSILETYIFHFEAKDWHISNTVFFSFYIILFMMIIRAYLCSPAKTKYSYS